MATGSEAGRVFTLKSERRVSWRFPCEGTAEVAVLGGALRFWGQIRDLSATGCRVATEVMFTLERGTQVEILMVVKGVRFRVAGGVRSTDRARGVGLEFMKVSARSALYVQDLIKELEVQGAKEKEIGGSESPGGHSASGDHPASGSHPDSLAGTS